jgi:hypothetical protein
MVVHRRFEKGFAFTVEQIAALLYKRFRFRCRCQQKMPLFFLQYDWLKGNGIDANLLKKGGMSMISIPGVDSKDRLPL